MDFQSSLVREISDTASEACVQQSLAIFHLDVALCVFQERVVWAPYF